MFLVIQISSVIPRRTTKVLLYSRNLNGGSKRCPQDRRSRRLNTDTAAAAQNVWSPLSRESNYLDNNSLVVRHCWAWGRDSGLIRELARLAIALFHIGMIAL